jgi:hypothetical protein
MKDFPACDLVLASAHRVAGTIDAATFDVRLAQDLKGPVRVVLRDFVVASSNANSVTAPLHVSLPDALNATCFDAARAGPTGHLTTIAPPLGQFREYPPAALSGTNTTLSGLAYGNGAYTVSSGGGWFDATWRVMDKNNVTSTTNRNYIVNTGLPQGAAAVVTTATNGVSYTGAWITVALPQAVRVTSYSVIPAADLAKGVSQWTLLGSSNGGTSWDHLDSRPYADMVPGQPTTRPVNPMTAYSSFRLVCERAGNTNYGNFRDYCSVLEWRLFGAPANERRPTRVDNGIVTDSSLFQRPLQVSVKPSDGVTWAAQDWAARLSILPCSL